MTVVQTAVSSSDVVTAISNDAEVLSGTSSSQQVMVATGGDHYQTVTIVPSDATTGEVSLLFVIGSFNF
jgi:hypothetical protein